MISFMLGNQQVTNSLERMCGHDGSLNLVVPRAIYLVRCDCHSEEAVRACVQDGLFTHSLALCIQLEKGTASVGLWGGRAALDAQCHYIYDEYLVKHY